MLRVKCNPPGVSTHCVFSYSENIHSTPPQPLYQDKGIGSSAYEVAEVQWTSAAPASRAQGQASASASEVEPYESVYSVGPGAATRLHTGRWERLVLMWKGGGYTLK